MGRAARFPEARLIEAAAALAAEGGPSAVTLAAVGQRSGAPVGSIYHRFPSRAALLARVWLDSAEAFQNEFTRRLADAVRWEDALPAALLTPEIARDAPLTARILCLHRRADFLGPMAPADLHARADALGRTLEAALAQFAARVLGAGTPDALALSRFALVDSPLAAVRPWIEAGDVPECSLALVRRTFIALAPGRA